MTNFNTAITTPQYAKLRSGHYAGDYLLTLCRNQVVFSGQLSAATSGLASWSFINYGSHVGSYTDIEPNMAILFSATNNIKTAQNNRGRVRFDYVANACATATTIHVSESSQDWAIGAYFWVLYTFDIVPRQSAFNFGVESIDFNQPYQGDPPVAPTLRTAYVGDCDPVTGKYRVAFDVSNAYSSEYGRTVTGFAWTFKSGTDTVISGSKSTAVVTIDFAPGEQWGKLRMTDSAGVTWDRRFYIHAHDADNPYDAGFDKLVISDSLQQGWTLRAPAFAGVDDVLSKTFGVVTRGTELYGYEEYHLDTNNVAFVGWVQREDGNLTPDPTYSLLSDTTFQLNGLSAMLARIGGQEIGVGFAAPLTPGAWGYNAHPTSWRAIIHYWAYYTTALFLAGFDADLKDDTYLYPSIAMTGQNSLDIPTSVARMINAGLFFAPDGRIRMDIDAGHWSAARRAADTPVATFTASDGLPVSYSNDLASYGLVDADGLYYNPTDGSVNAFKVRAPGTAMGEGQNRGTLSQQILAATTDATAARNELIQRANDELELLNITEVLTWKFPDGYNFLIASRGQTYAFIVDADIAGPNGVNRVVYDGTERFLCESVNYSLLGNGALDITATFRRLSRVGDSTGLDMTPGPDGNATDPDLTVPDIALPAFDWQLPELTWNDAGTDTALIPDPPAGKVALFDGSELIVHTATKAYYLKKLWATAQMKATDITPPDLGDYEIKAVAVDPFYTNSAIPVYLLASDGTNSAVWYTANGAIAVSTWTKGADLTGVYNVLRATNTMNNILACSPSQDADWSVNWNFATNNGGFVSYGRTESVCGPETTPYTPGTGWTEYVCAGPPQGKYINIARVFAGTTTLTDCEFTAVCGGGTYGAGNSMGIYIVRDGVETLIGTQDIPMVSTYTLTVSGTWENVSAIRFRVGITDNVTFDATIHVTSASAGGTGASPISGGSTNALVAFSDDRGATWASPLIVGATVGAVGGLDSQRAGTVSYASGADKVQKATTLGGAYSDFVACTGANPVCCILPYFRRNSATKITAVSDPDVLVALNTPDSDGGTLYWVNGTTAVKTDITPVSGITFHHANCITVRYGNELSVFGSVSGVWKLYKSTNGGTSWTLVKTLTNPQFIRCRRNDSRPSPNGLGYLADVNLWLTSSWYATGPNVRTMPTTPILGLETIY